MWVLSQVILTKTCKGYFFLYVNSFREWFSLGSKNLFRGVLEKFWSQRMCTLSCLTAPPCIDYLLNKSFLGGGRGERCFYLRTNDSAAWQNSRNVYVQYDGIYNLPYLEMTRCLCSHIEIQWGIGNIYRPAGSKYSDKKKCQMSIL